MWLRPGMLAEIPLHIHLKEGKKEKAGKYTKDEA